MNVVGPGAGTVTNQVTVSGAGSATAGGSDPTVITQGISFTVETNPPGLAFTLDGGAAQIAPQTSVLPLENHALAVAPVQMGGPGVQYVFTGWNDFGAAAHSVYPVSSPAVYTATFKTQYRLDVIVNPGPGGVVTPASGMYYDAGSVVSVSAAPLSPYIFDGWSGSVASAASGFSITMNAPASLVATFSVPGFTCDITGDSVLDIADLQSIVNEALGVSPPGHDLNRDGTVNVADVQKVLDAVLGLGCIY